MKRTSLRAAKLSFLLIQLLSTTFTFGQNFIDWSSANQFNITGQNRGIAVGDYNNDGLEDIYVTSIYGPNRLYKNVGGFRFVEVAQSVGLASTSSSTACLWVDLENDGDLDLMVANVFQPNEFYRNDKGQFTEIAGELGIDSDSNPRSLHAVDYDNDGDLDLYVAQVLDQNILWRNEGGQSFTNVTQEAGIDDKGRSLGALFFDYDLDGDQDLYQTRDGDESDLFWKNNGDGTFSEIGDQIGLGYPGMGMGVDIADLNEDGYPDIYLTNLYENKLFVSKGDGRFEEVSEKAGVDDIGMGWSTFFFDCNNNGLQDLYLANESKFGVNGISDIPNRLFLNQGNLRFFSPNLNGNIENSLGSYGAVYADFDQDGKLDLALTNTGSQGGNQIFKNETEVGNFVAFKLEGQESNFNGIGSRIVLFSENNMQTRWLSAGAGYISQNTSIAHFGIGTNEIIDSAIIYWPSGIEQTIIAPAVNTQHTIIESQQTITNQSGQLIRTDPVFPNQEDVVTVYFDAKEGNGELAGYDGDVYAHTGVISNFSSDDFDWQQVIGNWGTADSRVLMTPEGNDIYSISYKIDEFYNLRAGEEVRALSFVFRNANGTLVGRDTDGSDIFTPVFPLASGLLLTIQSPLTDQIIKEGDSLLLSFETNNAANIQVLDNEQVIFEDSTSQASFFIKPKTLGTHQIDIIAILGNDTTRVSRTYFVLPSDPTRQDPLIAIRDGLTYSDTSLFFQLYAPGKESVFLLCPWNDYAFDEDFLMNQTEDGNRFWIELPKSLFDNGNSTYQYLVDGNITIADPYAEVVLDPANDPFVDSRVLAALPTYPEGANGIVTAFDLDPQPYNWQENDFQPAPQSNLVIYELLLRDFLGDHSYTSLIDTLDYLEKLGVNAIELMPINEFEGNISWGYNPSFHLAVDKYYGSRDDLKRFIDEAHRRGIAVILDVVFNHAFSQSPLAQLYWDGINFRPSAENPWLNVTPRHPFNVGYDFNHESTATKAWVKRSLERWIQDYRFDGFRFDLSKGMTQTFSGNDAGLMSQYDASRIAILKDYADYIWSLDTDAYVILEHFADNREEKELADYGMMLWGNVNFQFAEAAMGYRSELRQADYTHRGWQNPNLIAYMESHDEERLMYKIQEFGDRADGYDTRNLSTALSRVAAASTIHYTVPGPKMLWQFGEIGYDFSINYCLDGTVRDDCRLEQRPVRWDYLSNDDRERLYHITSALIHLKTNYPTFSTPDFKFQDGNFFIKTVHLNHPEMDAVVVANFRVTETSFAPRFPYPGTWYEYFTQDSLEITDVNERFPLSPGDYRIYTSKRIDIPEELIVTHNQKHLTIEQVNLFPNPTKPGEQVRLELIDDAPIHHIQIASLDGKVVQKMTFQQLGKLVQMEIDRKIPPGLYIIQVQTNRRIYTGKLAIN